jgi:hypothetical protein
MTATIAARVSFTAGACLDGIAILKRPRREIVATTFTSEDSARRRNLMAMASKSRNGRGVNAARLPLMDSPKRQTSLHCS